MTLPKKLKHDAVYLLLRWFIFLFNSIPRPLALFLGAWVGVAACAVLKRDCYKSVRHLTLAFGDELSMAQKRNCTRDFFVNTGKNLADVLRLQRHFASEIKFLVVAEGLETLDAAFARGRGILGITGHIGNFELLAAYLHSQGYRTAVIGRELYDSRLNDLLVGNREALGLTQFATTDSPRKLLAWLKDGGGLGVLIDTDSSRVRGTFVPFFGRLSNTPIGQSLLGLKTGAAFVPMACLRMGGNQYRVVVKPEICPVKTGNTEEDARLMTQECTRVLESIIREHKSQWIWIHNRWHTRPEETT